MATAVSSATSAAVATQPTVPSGTRETTSNTSSDPFQTILAQTTTAAQSPQAAREANQAAFSAETAAQDEQDRLDQAAQAANDSAAALIAAQLGLTQLAATNTPLNPDGTPAATSPIASDAQKLTVPQTNTAALLGPPTQTNPLFRQAVAEAGRQNNTQVPGSVTQTTPPADAVPTAPAPVSAQPPAPTANTLPEVNAAQAAQSAGLASAVAAVQPGQRQVVPAQAPIVPGLLPAPPDAASAGLPTPVAAPQAPVEAAGVPDVSVGDRPGTAGDQFAAIASAASTLTVTAPPPAAASGFAPLLATATLATDTSATAAANAAAPLAEPTEGRGAKDGFGDPTSSAGLAPTFAPAQSPNAVSAAQTPTAVKTPDPVTQVADHIVTHAHVIARGGETEFRIRLDPPELGALKIRLTSDGDSIHGQVVVSNDAIRRMIESQLPELRQRLEDAGVSVQNFNVSTDTGSGAGAGGGDWGGYRSEFPAELPRLGAPAPRPAAPRTRGAIDVMA